MWRWIFNFLAAISFLLCVASVVLWIRSAHHLDWIGRTNVETFRSTRLESFDGYLKLESQYVIIDPDGAPRPLLTGRWRAGTRSMVDWPDELRLIDIHDDVFEAEDVKFITGPGFRSGDLGNEHRITLIAHAWLVVLTAVPPGLWFAMFWRRRRKHQLLSKDGE